MLRVGLTGGIAVGKSAVAGWLAEAGACVVDADHLVHALTSAGGEAVEAVVARFGPTVADGSGGIDRRALGEIVFADDGARRDLEAILHPLVRREADRRFDRARTEQGCRIAVFDAALLVETGSWRDFDRLVVVHCSPQAQMERLVRRDGITRDQARARIDAQSPAERKLEVADYVVDTNGTRAESREQTLRIYRELDRIERRRHRADRP